MVSPSEDGSSGFATRNSSRVEGEMRIRGTRPSNGNGFPYNAAAHGWMSTMKEEEEGEVDEDDTLTD